MRMPQPVSLRVPSVGDINKSLSRNADTSLDLGPIASDDRIRHEIMVTNGDEKWVRLETGANKRITQTHPT